VLGIDDFRDAQVDLMKSSMLIKPVSAASSTFAGLACRFRFPFAAGLPGRARPLPPRQEHISNLGSTRAIRWE